VALLLKLNRIASATARKARPISTGRKTSVRIENSICSISALREGLLGSDGSIGGGPWLARCVTLADVAERI
jgi:hypothetical protein